MPPRASRVLSVLRRPGPPQGYAATVCGTPPAASPPPVPRGPRSVRVMLSRTSSLTDLIRQSGELPAISRHPPVIGPVLDIHWIILSVLLTFRAFTAVLSRIAACNTPEAPLRAPQFFRSGTGHRVRVRPLATPFIPQISFMRECLFGASFVRSRYGPPACSPPGLTRPVRPSGPTGLPGLLLPGFQVTGSPHVPAGYHYGTKLRIVPAGLAPASTSASLAAPPRDHASWAKPSGRCALLLLPCVADRCWLATLAEARRLSAPHA